MCCSAQPSGSPTPAATCTVSLINGSVSDGIVPLLAAPGDQYHITDVELDAEAFVNQSICGVVVETTAPPTTTSEPRLCEPRALDLVLVLDGSASVGGPQFLRQLDLAAAVVGALDNVSPNGTRVAAVLIQTTPVLLFGLEAHDTAAQVQQTLQDLTYVSNQGSSLEAALRMVRQQVLTPGQDRPAAPNVVLVVSDGATTPVSSVQLEADALHAVTAETLAVWLGNQTASPVDQSKIQALAQPPVVNYFIFADLVALQDANQLQRAFVDPWACAPDVAASSAAPRLSTSVVAASSAVIAPSTSSAVIAPSTSSVIAPSTSSVAAVAPSSFVVPAPSSASSATIAASSSSLATALPSSDFRGPASTSSVLPVLSTAGPTLSAPIPSLSSSLVLATASPSLASPLLALPSSSAILASTTAIVPTTTPGPTVPNVCLSGAFVPLDLAVVLDASGSIGPANFDRQIQLAVDMISALPLPSVQVAVVLISSEPSVVFDLGEFSSAAAMEQLLNNLTFPVQRASDLGRALQLVQRRVFSPVNGFRGGAAVTVVMSDGGARPVGQLAALAAELAQVTRIITLTVGSVDQDDAARLAVLSPPEDQYDFDTVALWFQVFGAENEFFRSWACAAPVASSLLLASSTRAAAPSSLASAPAVLSSVLLPVSSASAALPSSPTVLPTVLPSASPSLAVLSSQLAASTASAIASAQASVSASLSRPLPSAFGPSSSAPGSPASASSASAAGSSASAPASVSASLSRSLPSAFGPSSSAPGSSASAPAPSASVPSAPGPSPSARPSPVASSLQPVVSRTSASSVLRTATPEPSPSAFASSSALVVDATTSVGVFTLSSTASVLTTVAPEPSVALTSIFAAPSASSAVLLSASTSPVAASSASVLFASSSPLVPSVSVPTSSRSLATVAPSLVPSSFLSTATPQPSPTAPAVVSSSRAGAASTPSAVASASSSLSPSFPPSSSSSSSSSSSLSSSPSPAPSATPGPVFCTYEPVDVVLVFDGSGSVGPAGFAQQVQAAIDLVALLDVTRVQVAAVLMTSSVEVRFALADLTTVAAVQAALRTLEFVPQQGSAGRNTLDVVRRGVLSSLGGYRGGRAYVFFMSDGSTSDPDALVEFAAGRLRNERDATVVTLAINQPVANVSQLPLIASSAADMLLLDQVSADATLLPLRYLCALDNTTTPATTTPETTTGTPTTSDTVVPTTTVEPELCTLRDPLDLVFVIDASGSVTPDVFVQQIEFAATLVGQLPVGPRAVRLAAVTVTSAPQTVLDLDQTVSAAQVQQHLRNLVQPLNDGSALAGALGNARSILRRAASLRNASLVVVIADGAQEPDSVVLNAIDRLLPLADLALLRLPPRDSNPERLDLIGARALIDMRLDDAFGDGLIADEALLATVCDTYNQTRTTTAAPAVSSPGVTATLSSLVAAPSSIQVTLASSVSAPLASSASAASITLSSVQAPRSSLATQVPGSSLFPPFTATPVASSAPLATSSVLVRSTGSVSASRTASSSLLVSRTASSSPLAGSTASSSPLASSTASSPLASSTASASSAVVASSSSAS